MARALAQRDRVHRLLTEHITAPLTVRSADGVLSARSQTTPGPIEFAPIREGEALSERSGAAAEAGRMAEMVEAAYVQYLLDEAPAWVRRERGE
jgi:hypothetical protein